MDQPGGRHSCQLSGSVVHGEIVEQLGFRFVLGSTRIQLWSPLGPCLYLTHQVADSLLPLILSASGRLVLHGAGLITEKGCVAVLGESMAGKSTLTGSWVARGGQFLSDDWLSLRTEAGGISAAPSHPSIRVRESSAGLVNLPGVPCHEWEDGYAKRWFSLDHGSASFPGSPVPLRSILSFSRSSTASRLTVRGLPPRLAVKRLLAHVYLLDARSNRFWDPILEGIARIVKEVPAEEIEVPEGRAGLDAFARWLDTRKA